MDKMQLSDTFYDPPFRFACPNDGSYRDYRTGEIIIGGAQWVRLTADIRRFVDQQEAALHQSRAAK